MNTFSLKAKSVLISALSASLLASAGAAGAASGDVTLEAEVVALRKVAEGRGEWVNRYVPHGTGRYAAPSADENLAAMLPSYTREALDRGGWVNPYVSSPRYCAGNSLLAVPAGEGVTTTVAAPSLVAPPVIAHASR